MTTSVFRLPGSLWLPERRFSPDVDPLRVKGAVKIFNPKSPIPAAKAQKSRKIQDMAKASGVM
jgi:hypothetical protein